MIDPTKLVDIYEHLFAEPGWKELVTDLLEKRESIKNAMVDSSWNYDQIQFYRGLTAGYRYVTELESTVQQAKIQNQSDAEGLPDVP